MADKRRRWKPHHIEFIKKHQADITRQELCELLKANFDDLPKGVNRANVQLLINRRLKLKSNNDGKMKKGDVPWNKGKTGYTTSVGFEIGEETTSSHGYKLVKIANSQHGWQFKHILVWEAANGKVPEGHCLKFIDNDKTNCDLNNLMLIPKPVLTRVNHSNPANTNNPELNKAILLTETLKQKARELQHGR